MDGFNKVAREMSLGDSFFNKVVKSMVICSMRGDITKLNDLSPAVWSKLWKIPINLTSEVMDTTIYISMRVKNEKMSQRFRIDLFQNSIKD